MHKAKSHGEIPSLKTLILQLIAHTYSLAMDTASGVRRAEHRGSVVADDPACMEKYSAML